MAERLTEKHNNGSYTGKGNDLWDILTKLGKLEDILEKYDIESVEELDFRLAFKQNDVFNYKVVTELEQERDTWQRACELACDAMTKLGGDDCCGCRLNKEMCKICENKKGLIDYFYQQAKTEGNDE